MSHRRDPGQGAEPAWVLAGCAAVVLAVLAATNACHRTERTSLPPGPPAPKEVVGTYRALWASGGATLEGLAVVTEELVRFVSFPCFPPGLEELAAGYRYEPADGSFVAEGKTVDGVARLLLLGAFDERGELAGTYQVQVLGEPCAQGAVRLER